MRAARHRMFARVDPEAKKPDPEGKDVRRWADDLDGRTEDILNRRSWGAVDAATVRRRKGDVLITDGPFTGTKE